MDGGDDLGGRGEYVSSRLRDYESGEESGSRYSGPTPVESWRGRESKGWTVSLCRYRERGSQRQS